MRSPVDAAAIRRWRGTPLRAALRRPLTRGRASWPVDTLAGESDTRFIVRFFTLCSLGVIALTIAACGGGGGDENFTQSDVLQILGTSPTKPAGSSWAKNGGTRQNSLAELRRDVRRLGAGAYKDEVEGLTDAGYERGFTQEWTSRGTFAAGEATLFPDTSGAEKGFAFLQRLTPGWFLPLPVEGLGDEAVSSKGDLGAGYMWRRGNLLLAAWINRATGPFFDYDAAARAYADKLDGQARAR
jgi:hypothetical protein